MSRVIIADAPADTDALRRALQRPGSGGFCVFEGWVRETNEGREVSGLDYEAYRELAVSEGERIIDEAVARFGVADAGAERTRLASLGVEVGELQQVENALRAGHGWPEIATALGVTRQAVHKKYGRR